MKDLSLIDTPSQKEALINEFKGNLFEYLVGHHLSRSLNIESRFLRSINPELKSRLQFYEHWLRENDADLTVKLPNLAAEASFKLQQKLPTVVTDIYLTGKNISGISSKQFSECDILIKSNELYLPISLKFCKQHAFVNTKSAGIRSFVGKYFKNFSNIDDYQAELNELVDKVFFKMGHKLYEMEGLDFEGHFDHRWDELALPRLPGKLNAEMKEIVHGCYYEIISKIHKIFQKIFSEDKKFFMSSLYPLIGLSDENMIQVTLFHGQNKKERYLLKEVHILSHVELDESVELLPFKERVSSFEILLPGMRLQIRVKPMNTFTQAAYKINCSVKYE